MVSECQFLLNPGNKLEIEDSLNLSYNIHICLNTLTIYEYVDNQGLIIPVIDPSISALNDGFILNPISNESKFFLSKLNEFLQCKESIRVY